MNNLKYFLKLYALWIIYFTINRLFFILYFFEYFKLSDSNEIFTIFLKSIALDVSFISYLIVFIILFMFIGNLFVSDTFKNFIKKLIFYFNTFFIVISALIISGEMAIYSHWGTKLNFKAISHLQNPSEVFSTASYKDYLLVVFLLIIAFLFIKLYSKFIHEKLELRSFNSKLLVLNLTKAPLVLGVLLVLIRGGIKEIPINTSDAYFSDNIIVNDVTVNPNWNFFQSLIKSRTNLNGNPYQKFPSKPVKKLIDSINSDDYNHTQVLKLKKPNIIFIILESWSADNIPSLGGLNGITPNFEKLEKKGLNFTNFYSNGWTSDQAMSSIFSSFPVFPYVAIINQTDKSRKLPCLNKSLNISEYHSSFFFGGQLTYGNIKGYLLAQGFDIVKDENNFKHLPSGRLGVHDEFMFSQFKNELSVLPQPFLSSLFTISSHSPYDFPADHLLSFNSNEDKYINSVAYTDKCLGDFFDSVKNENWYDNTLFIILSDHSHNSPLKRRVAQKERFKIPMLWYGEVLKKEYMGESCDILSSHIDVTPTILKQLNISNNNYKFGSDIFNKKSSAFVPYAFPKGYGLIDDIGNYAYSEAYNKILELQLSDTTYFNKIKVKAEMFMQGSFNYYLQY